MTVEGVTPAAHRPDEGQAKLRIVQVAACPFPANHGTPGAIRELALALERLGHEVHVVTYPMSEDLPTDGLQIHRVDAPKASASAWTWARSPGAALIARAQMACCSCNFVAKSRHISDACVLHWALRRSQVS